MADDRMRNDDLDKNMGGHQGQQGGKGDYGKQSPGRNKQDDLSTGQRGAGQQGEPDHLKDDFGTSGKSGVGNKGTQGSKNM